MQTLLIGFLLIAAPTSQSWPGQSNSESQLRKSINEFSAAMQESGFGWEGHAAFLHEDFTRSYNGGATVDRGKHVDGIKQWWQSGNRVHKSERDIKYLRISGDIAIVRIDIVEHHSDSAGTVSEAFDGHVSQVWMRNEDAWELLSNEVISRRD